MDLSDLNPSQREAVLHDNGPMLVLAGAGSGKTRVVTRRIARLVEEGTPAWSIVAVTFTNKAAAEMKERVAELTGRKVAKELRVTTFHSFGLEVLSREAAALGFRRGEFTIFDQADSMSTVREILRTIDAGKRFDIASILGRISVAKNAFETEETWVPREGDEYDEIAKMVYPRYISQLRAFQAFDFDDLVTETVTLLKKREDVRARIQAKIRYLLVDEYQDTNASQLELVRLLVSGHNNVAVVGDDDQSIYAWRGADVRNILDFEEHFTGAKVVKLEENYRSVASVLNVANAVLAESHGRRHGKILRATRAEGAKVEVILCSDPDIEAAHFADEIEKALRETTWRPKDVAVLYRSNAQAEPIELALKERRIPHRILGGQKFYERKEVKDLLAYVKIALSSEDEMSLRRVINYPARGIGDAALMKLTMFATAREISLWDAVLRAQVIEDLPGAAIEGCAQLEKIVMGARESFANGMPANEIARKLADTINLREDIHESTPGEAAARRWGNVESILKVLARRDERGPADLAAVKEYLRLLSLQTETEEAAEDVVTLATIHGAKGLEFKLVLVAGIEEGFLPHSRTVDPKTNAVVPQDIEEERRLFYVAITRAKDRLILSRNRVRVFRGKPSPRTISRFLQTIPPELIEEREVNLKPVPDAADLADSATAFLAALDAPTTATGLTQRPFARRR